MAMLPASEPNEEKTELHVIGHGKDDRFDQTAAIIITTVTMDCFNFRCHNIIHVYGMHYG